MKNFETKQLTRARQLGAMGLAVRVVMLVGMIVAGLNVGGCKPREVVPVVAKDPKLTVVSVVVERQTADGVALAITIDAENPNEEALPLMMARYTVKLDGGASVSLEESVHRTLPGSGTQKFVLTAALPLGKGETGEALWGRTCVVRGSVVYDPPGIVRRFLRETQVPAPTVSFHGKQVLEK